MRGKKREYNVLEIKSRNCFSEDKVSSWQMLLLSQERQRLRIELKTLLMMRMSLVTFKGNFSEIHSRPNGKNLQTINIFYCKVNDRDWAIVEGLDP